MLENSKIDVAPAAPHCHVLRDDLGSALQSKLCLAMLGISTPMKVCLAFDFLRRILAALNGAKVYCTCRKSASNAA